MNLYWILCLQGSFRSIVGLISSLFYVFATLPRFLSSFQLLVSNELFHQSSFYLKNIVSSFQLLFQKSYLHFSPGEKSGGKCPGGNVLDPPLANSPMMSTLIANCKWEDEKARETSLDTRPHMLRLRK